MIDLRDIENISVTGSGGKMVAELLKVGFVNEVVAFVEANSILYPEVRTIIDIGGEDSRFISLRYDKSIGKTIISDFAMNQLCAAGTGSFLDQQASRLGIPIGEFGKIALKSKHPARIAGRCSVFAKTDMIHLQQRATPTCDIVAGLCYALARSFKSIIAKGKEFHKPISFQGGVAANVGVVKAFEVILGLSCGELFIPSNFATLGAIGAAFVCMDKEYKRVNYESFKEIEGRLKPKETNKTTLRPLGEGYQVPVKKYIQPAYSFSGQNKIDAYMGVDVGSISTNLAVLDEEGNLLTKRYLLTSGKPIEAVSQGLKEIGEELGDEVNIRCVCTTGSGRYMIGDIIGADIVKNEIITQARAAIEIDENVDTIFEIGGQDSKYISIKDEIVVDFEMNKVCAAGTGSFLEEQAERLNIDIKEEFSKLALETRNPVELGERCTVFMGTNIGHYQAHGTSREDIAAGLCYSIVLNYLNRVVRRKKIGNNIFFQGGVAFNKGVHAAFEKILGKKITIPPNHEVTGAVGCALIARDNAPIESNFKGFNIADEKYKIKFFTCQDCSNKCEINEVIVGERTPLFYGSRCGKYDIEKKKKSSNIPDLFAERENLLLGSCSQSSVQSRKSSIKIGIPRCMVTFYEFFPFWNTFFTELGFEVVLSDRTNKNIIQVGLESAVSDFCFPIKVSHGHILNLAEKKVDYIFLPAIIDLERDPFVKNTFTCPYVQSLPNITEVSIDLKNKGIKLFRPVLHYRRGRKHIEDILTNECKEFGISDSKIQNALQKAYKHQNKFLKTIKKRGKDIIGNLKGDEQVAVIIGRLYNTCDLTINLEIPERLRERNLMAIPIDYLPLDKVDISKEWPNMYWHHGLRILKAAKLINKNKNLYAVYLTNFGCGPDSFILSFFSRAMADKSYLEIEVDEHSADVGVITRCEAFLDSLQNIKSRKNKYAK